MLRVTLKGHQMTPALRFGLVGTGHWARITHAPALASTDGVELAAVWGRNAQAAADLAASYHATAHHDLAAFLADVDAVAFAVPPDVQAAMAIDAANAGKAVLLEKPLALSVDAAERLADAVHANGVGSSMVLTWRYAPVVRSFLDAAAAVAPVGGRAWFLSGALLGGWFSTPWRLQWGALPDLGPHVIDLLDAALGPVVDIRAHGDSLTWVGLLLEHESGAVSEASLSGTIDPSARRAGCEVFSRTASAEVDCNGVSGEATAVLRASFVEHARDPRPHPLDVDRGLHLQRLVDAAQAQL